jgi:hypothetical protein
MSKIHLLRGVATCAITALVVASGGYALADDATTPQAAPEPVTIANTVVEPGADATYEMGENKLDTVRENQTEALDGAPLPAEDAQLVDQVVEASDAAGEPVDPDSVDVFSVLQGDVTIAIPVTVEIDELTVDVNDLDVAVSASTTETSEPTIDAAGPGMNPNWEGDGDGQYVIKVQGLGDSLFVWSRKHLADDGDPDHTWYVYKRKGDAHPYSVTGPDADVKILRIQSYPYDSIESRLENWTDWAPASGFSGQCDGHVYTASIDVKAASFGVSFQDCDGYDVWRNVDNPGSYWQQMDQGVVLHGGSREAGYVVGWKAQQGTPGSQHDFQRVIFHNWFTNFECSSYDSDKTC